MDFRFNPQPTRAGYGASLLLILLQAFPEIGSANYDPANRGFIRLTFFFSEALDQERQKALSQLIADNVRAFQQLTGNAGTDRYSLTVSFGTDDCFQSCTIARDIRSLSRDELQLIVALLNDHLGTIMIREKILQPERFDEVGDGEELIDQIMDQLRLQPAEMRLWGVKDEGRAFVYHK